MPLRGSGDQRGDFSNQVSLFTTCVQTMELRSSDLRQEGFSLCVISPATSRCFDEVFEID